MTIPALVFGFVVASLYGALYHLARGGAAWRLLLYLALSWTGFVLGHLLGLWLQWDFIQVGPLNLGAATVGSLALLGIGDWLSHIERAA